MSIPITTWEQFQELAMESDTDSPENSWLIEDSMGTEPEGLSELLSTGSVTVHIAGRHFVIALCVQEVDEHGQAK